MSLQRMHYIGPKDVQSIFSSVGHRIPKDSSVTLCLVAENLLVIGEQEDLKTLDIFTTSLHWLNLSVRSLAENRPALDYVAGKSETPNEFRVIAYSGSLTPLGAFIRACRTLKREPDTVMLYVASQLLVVGRPAKLKTVVNEFPYSQSEWRNSISGKRMEYRRSLGYLERDDQYDLLELMPEKVRELI